MATIDTSNLPSMDHMSADSKNLVLAVLDWATGAPVQYERPGNHGEFKTIRKAKFLLGRKYLPTTVPAAQDTAEED